ncbi:tRNA 4-thiouridine(8) synthase ThiI [bacterium]|nr:tRNA 4-thiouridine(8) synthase ThiI [bacterium]
MVTDNSTEFSFCHMLLKPGEMLLKSKPVRRAFSQRLIYNLWDAIRHSGFSADGTQIRREQAIVAVKTNDPGVRDTIRRVFGITSIALVERIDTSSLQRIVEEGFEHFKDAITGKRFAVRCKRSGDTNFKSRDVAIALGAALQPFSAGVDLTNPEITCRLDIHSDSVKFYADETPAYGGLPIGTQGKAIALISGGIDSPVAAWYGLKRGLEVHYLFCCLGGPLQHWGPTEAARLLASNWSYGYKPKLFIADFNELLHAFRNLDGRYRNILLKRYLYRTADRLARRIGADAIITGEALGQVSSQTLSNLQTITQVTNRLIMRPLIGFDKTEIITRARDIGSLKISEKVPEYCNLAVNKPRTSSSPWELDKLEQELDPNIVERAVSNWETHYLRSMPAHSPPGDPILNHQPPDAWCVWIDNPEIPGAPTDDLIINETIDVLSIRKYIKSFNRSGILLFSCVKGTMSRDAALYAREKGLDAYRIENTRDNQ